MNYREFISTRQASADLRTFLDGPYGTAQNREGAYPDPIPGFAYCGGSYAIEQLADGGGYRVIIQFENDFPDLASAEFELFYYYGRHVGRTVELNLFERMEMACRSSDLDAACRYIQDGLGVESGDNAALFFSYCSESEGPNPENWRTRPAARFNWMRDYIRSELNVVEARLYDSDYPGHFEPSTVIARLKLRGFVEAGTGGGCMAMSNPNFGGGVYVLATDNDCGLPTDEFCLFGVYDDGGQPVGTYQGDGAGFENAYKQAIEHAQRLDMEQSAKRRGDL